MDAISNLGLGFFSLSELGEAFRANRLALKKTQSDIAKQVGCRRQTIADLEAGKNVETYTLMSALSALGKGLMIVDARVDFDRISEMFQDD